MDALSKPGFAWTLLTILTLVTGCTQKPPQPASSPKAEAPPAPSASAAAPTPPSPPVDVDAMLAREAADLVPTDVKGPAGAFTARVSSKGAPEATLNDRVATVEIPIGADTPVRCQV